MSKDKDIIQSFIKLGCKCSNNGYHLYAIQKWLREVKNIHLIVSMHEFPEWNFGIQYIDSKNNGIINRNMAKQIKWDVFDYITYEEALEAGIWEAYYLLNN